ncbi:MAG: SCO family protein [Candidatus Accumulibacter sp.]|uniref:SCO family protein n=1 Tax=Accumulibacter sp. TaxID=2053492 RepID=UPI002879694B|nr:SCO family protein [Accumulibacter sp.]MDS4016528.1 SCO family protein [Accumulibacter sp.]
MNKARALGFVAGGVILVLIAAWLIWRGVEQIPPVPAFDPRQARLSSATVLNDEKPLPAFSLLGARGRFDNSALAGRWTLMFFGYTFCPDVCPTALLLLKELKAKLAERSIAAPQVVMVSLDPARDTPATLKNYTAAFDADFFGVTGSDEALAPLVKHLGVYYLRHEQGTSSGYLVDHSAAIYLIDPQGRLKAVFSPPQDLARMLVDYPALVR